MTHKATAQTLRRLEAQAETQRAQLMAQLHTPAHPHRALPQWELQSLYNQALFEAQHPSELPAVPEPESLQAMPRFRGLPVGFMFYRDAQGRPDFKIIDPARVDKCERARLCGLCGAPLGEEFVVCGGPLTQRNRVSTDPPFHPNCARFAFGVCPFLLGQTDYAKATHLLAQRKETAPWHTDLSMSAPKLQALLFTTTYRCWSDHMGHKLFLYTPWTRVEWFQRVQRSSPKETAHR